MRTTFGRISILSALLGTLCTALFLAVVWSVDDALEYQPALKVLAYDTPAVTAKAYLIFDLESGTEIASHNSTDVLPIASVTKLATAAAFLETADLAASTTIAWSDVAAEGRAGKLEYGQEYVSRELLYPLLIESSNDAAEAMTRIDPELLDAMNAYARLLNLPETSFGDASGLSSDNVSTAYELFVLTRALHQEHPHVFDITQVPQYIGRHTGWVNNNPFAQEPAYKGGKHGFTNAANRTAVALFEEEVPEAGTLTIGYVILGSDDLVSDMEQLRAIVKDSVRFQ